MVKISKPISSERVVDYHREQYAAPESAAYYSEGGQVVGQFHGELAREWGLLDQPATEEIVSRLAEGQHPRTGEQLVNHRKPVAVPAWQTADSAWAERLQAQLERSVLAAGDPFAEAPAGPGRPKNPESITEEPRVIAAPEYDEHQRVLIAMHEEVVRFL